MRDVLATQARMRNKSKAVFTPDEILWMEQQGLAVRVIERVDRIHQDRRDEKIPRFPTTREMYEQPEVYVAFNSGPWAVDMEGMGTTLEVDGTEYSWHAPESGDPNYYG